MILGTAKAPLQFVADATEREAFLASRQDAVLVSASLPMRANLTMIENIALVLQFQQSLGFDEAVARVLPMLERLGRHESAMSRDTDLDHEDRFVAKFLRAALMEAPIILVDRPALQLPDIRYPPFLDTLLSSLADEFETCWIVDYAWNAPLYDRLPSGTSA
jgi:hypothetical protein